MARKSLFPRLGTLFNLRTKLIVVLLLVNLVSITIVALLTNNRAIATLTEDAGGNVKRLAETQAADIGFLLTAQFKQLSYLSLNNTLRQNVLLANLASIDQMNIAEIDQQWQAADDSDPFIKSRLENASALELKQFVDFFPNQPELFITDKHGVLVAATNRTSDFYQADEGWWQAAYNQGQGATYVGIPEYDESSDIVATIIAIPIYNQTASEVIGILRTTYDMVGLNDVLLAVNLGQTGRSELYLPGNLEFEPDHQEVDPTDFDPRSLVSASFAEAVFVEDVHDDVPSMIGLAPVLVDLGDSASTDLGWTVTVFQDREEALRLVNEQNRSTIFLVFFIALGTVGLGFVAAQLLTGPIKRLTAVAQEITAGDFTRRAVVENQDEVGTLALAFNTMTERLRESIENLESRVTERTEQLETVLEVSGRLTGILDLDDLTRQVVTLTKETFDYYHVHIYLLAESDETLVMAEGYGSAGAEMKRQGHSIPLAAPRSLVARSAREGQVIIVGDVQADPSWLANPLLPATRSEMAVPIILDSNVVGVLDVQSDQVAGLTEVDQATLQVLADQIAIAVRNANLFAEVRQKLDEAERLQRLYVSQAWQQLRITQERTHFEVGYPTLTDEGVPEVDAVLQQGRTVDLKIPTTALEANGHGSDQGQGDDKTRRALATPLKLHNQIVGVLGIQDENSDRQWTEDEIALIESVSEQMSLAIENARLFDETRRNAWRDQVVSESTAKIWSSDEVEAVMKVAVAQLADKLHASEVVLRLGSEEELT